MFALLTITSCYALHHYFYFHYVNKLFLGQSIPDDSKTKIVPNEVKRYSDIMRQQYKYNPVVITEWPPRIGPDHFGRLILTEKQDSDAQAWQQNMRKEHINGLSSGKKELTVEDVLRPKGRLSLRVLIDGPPGIGKTTLCQKLLNMWANGTLMGDYAMVLYCPLKNKKIARATTIDDLFVIRTHEGPKVADLIDKNNGERALIIFDDWDEITAQDKQTSLVASIIRRERLIHSSVVITSRTYASSSLLEMTSISRHVHVVGFSEEGMSEVIIHTIQKDPRLAQELIDKRKEDNSGLALATVAQNNRESMMALKLIDDLRVRSDIRSLCYVPVICAVVILIFCKERGRLPTTLTQLFENFVLQTVRRHVKKTNYTIEPRHIYSLDRLPLDLDQSLLEICQVAYLSLVNENKNTKSSLLQSISRDCFLGLMTSFIEYDEEKHQFLHLSIQEFLAAWWIVKQEDAESVFKDHFGKDHFQMCLRFVAGLSHFEHESYQEYFAKQLLVPYCRRKPQFKFDSLQSSWFHKNPENRENNHIVSCDGFVSLPVFLLQLLFESQNKTLCNVLAQSLPHHSLCLEHVPLSLFDILCLGYFISNSDTAWEHLDLRSLNFQELSVFSAGLAGDPKQRKVSLNSFQEFSIFTAELTNNPVHCKRLTLNMAFSSADLVDKLLNRSILQHLQECYCELHPEGDQNISFSVLMQFFSLSQLAMLHFSLMANVTNSVGITDTGKYSDLQKRIEMNSKLLEMKITCSGGPITPFVACVIEGVTKNKAMTSLSIVVSKFVNDNPIPDGIIEKLLVHNKTLQALSLDMPDNLLPSSLEVVEVNTPLTALEIGRQSSKLMGSFFPLVKGLSCLMLPGSYPLGLLLSSHPNLHSLTLSLNTTEDAIEIFNALQTNSSLEAFRLEETHTSMYRTDSTLTSDANVCSSLEDMLKQNQTLKCFEVMTSEPSVSFLASLATGLKHNTSLQQLTVSVPLSTNEHVKTFFNVIAQKKNLMELNLAFGGPEPLYRKSSITETKEIKPFYELLLPAVTSMLQSHTTIRLLNIKCAYINELPYDEYWIKRVKCMYETIFIHPSLEYVEINTGPLWLTSFLKDIFKDQQKALIARHKEKQSLKPLPIVLVT